jgi:hypothetical protein
MSEDTTNFQPLGRFKYAALMIGIISAILWVIGYTSDASVNHQQSMYSYLFGFIFWGSITIGCFGLTLLQGSLKASWAIPLIRIFEAAGGPGMLIVLLVLFIPIAMPSGLHAIYAWSNDAVIHADKIVASKTWYLNPTGFWVRTGIVFAIWIFWARLMRRSTHRQDETLSDKEWHFRSNWGSPGLVMFFVTVTLIATDWAMSLEPRYYSTIYPIIFTIGAALSAMSLAVLIVLYNSNKDPYRATVTPKLVKDFGNMFLALTMLWAYTTLSQFLITWQGNLPLETPYYINRTGGPIGSGAVPLDWNVLSNIVILFQFFVPFLALIAPRTKRVVRNLIWTAVLIGITRIFTVYWLIFPSVRHQGFGESLTHWTDYAAFLGIGGIWFAIFAYFLTKAPLMPRYDTRLLEVEHA